MYRLFVPEQAIRSTKPKRVDQQIFACRWSLFLRVSLFRSACTIGQAGECVELPGARKSWIMNAVGKQLRGGSYMKRIVAGLAALGLWAAVAAPPEMSNMLTAKEKSDGWMLLFDGKTLNGWTHTGKAE